MCFFIAPSTNENNINSFIGLFCFQVDCHGKKNKQVESMQRRGLVERKIACRMGSLLVSDHFRDDRLYIVRESDLIPNQRFQN